MSNVEQRMLNFEVRKVCWILIFIVYSRAT